MTKNKSDKVTVEVLGGNCEDVTGSCTQITFNKRTVLFECGMIQNGHTPLENYQLNKRLLSKIKHKDKIEYVFAGHCHADHIALIPALYKNGFNGITVVPYKSTAILREMWLDSAHINQRDAELISMKRDKSVEPLYDEEDVEVALQHIKEYKSNEMVQIDEQISIRFISAGHILLSQQMELYVSPRSNLTKKILFTSDLGNLNIENQKFYVDKFVPVYKANLVIGECTYSEKGRGSTKKDVVKDIEKIKTVIDQYCVDRHKRVLCPTFSLDRTFQFLSILYDLFSSDENFKVPIVVDSPLSNHLLDVYGNILEDENKERFDQIMSWANIRRIISTEDSKTFVASKESAVILASSGMCTGGRVLKYLQEIMKNPEDCILFTGFSTEGTLAYKIKNTTQRYISVNGKPVPNKCQIVSISSLSSHMQREDLLKYYGGIHTEKICLVHSNMKGRLEFSEDLKERREKNLMSGKVVCATRDMKINL